MHRTVGGFTVVASLFLAGCASNAPHTVVRSSSPVINHDDEEEDDADDSEAALFRKLDETFARTGEVKDGVYRLVMPRSDLSVTVDGMDVPTGAFLESDFRFWRCPCGKLLVNGQFVLADYEANDVTDELHRSGLTVASIAPLLLYERPRLLLIRFQGEGHAKALATALKSALGYTGNARNAPMPANLAPPAE
jgi:hypothetical protein